MDHQARLPPPATVSTSGPARCIQRGGPATAPRVPAPRNRREPARHPRHTASAHRQNRLSPPPNMQDNSGHKNAATSLAGRDEYTRCGEARPIPQGDGTVPAALYPSIQGDAAAHTSPKKGSKSAEPDNLGAVIAWERQRRQPLVFGARREYQQEARPRAGSGITRVGIPATTGFRRPPSRTGGRPRSWLRWPGREPGRGQLLWRLPAPRSRAGCLVARSR
jgi:hypothetical protein